MITTDPGASIFVDGKEVGNETTTIRIPKDENRKVRVEKIGYITQEKNYPNNKSIDLPRSDYLEMEVDDAYENSVSTDIANTNVDIVTNDENEEDDSWLNLNRVVLDYFDVLETSDKETGYLRTAWALNKFRAANIRTRLIVKYAGKDPLTYKVKLLSEIAPNGTSVKADEIFDEWDRVLKQYQPVIDDLRSRLAK